VNGAWLLLLIAAVWWLVYLVLACIRGTDYAGRIVRPARSRGGRPARPDGSGPMRPLPARVLCGLAAVTFVLAGCGPDDDAPEPDLSGRLERIHDRAPGP
jgi:hypothetical protein